MNSYLVGPSFVVFLNLSFVENYYRSIPSLTMFTKQSITILTALAKQSMINRLLNLINRNRSAPKISKVMSSSVHRSRISRIPGK